MQQVFPANLNSPYRLYQDFVLEVTAMVVLGQDIGLQRGEGQEFKRLINVASDFSHGKYINGTTDAGIECTYIHVQVRLSNRS